MFQEIFKCASLTLFILINTSTADDAPIVKLPHGQIQGHILKSPLGNTLYYAYQDIPYAAPPVGNLRFQPPVEPESWDGVLNTTHNTHSCYLNGREDEIAPDVTQSEDCLYLNVYTPVNPESNSSLPVLFWIHGGGFFFGDGTFQVYGPQFLIDYDIVIVTFNYRLGAFGFLTTEDGVIPGNIGLKDQNFALRWVNNTIGLFGGDRTRITIVGESAGGASVGYHILSKKSEELFRGAILQSGTAICSFGFQHYPNYYAFKMGNILNSDFDSENSTELLELLQSVPAEDINNISMDVPDELTVGVRNDDLVWLPIIETTNLDEAFIVAPMHEDIRTGNINKTPIMLGFNSEEVIVFIADDDDTISDIAEKRDGNLSSIVNGKYNMSDNDKPLAGRMLRYLSDSDFTTPIIQHAELQSKYGDVYLYQFSYKGMMGSTNTTRKGVDTVGHAEDLKYLWHIDRLDDGSIFPVGDRLTQRRLLKLWSNFVKHLNPTPENDPILENITWPTVTADSADNITYLNINRTLEVKSNPRQYKEFKTIVNRYAKPPLSTY